MSTNDNKNKFKFDLKNIKKVDNKSYVSFEIDDGDFREKFYGAINGCYNISDGIINGTDKVYVDIKNFDICQIEKHDGNKEWGRVLGESTKNKSLYMSSGFKEALFDKGIVSEGDVDNLFRYSGSNPISIDKLDAGNFFKISVPGEEGDENVKYFGIDDDGNLFISNASRENKGYCDIEGEKIGKPVSYMEYPGLVAKIKQWNWDVPQFRLIAYEKHEIKEYNNKNKETICLFHFAKTDVKGNKKEEFYVPKCDSSDCYLIDVNTGKPLKDEDSNEIKAFKKYGPTLKAYREYFGFNTFLRLVKCEDRQIGGKNGCLVKLDVFGNLEPAYIFVDQIDGKIYDQFGDKRLKINFYTGEISEESDDKASNLQDPGCELLSNFLQRESNLFKLKYIIDQNEVVFKPKKDNKEIKAFKVDLEFLGEVVDTVYVNKETTTLFKPRYSDEKNNTVDAIEYIKINNPAYGNDFVQKSKEKDSFITNFENLEKALDEKKLFNVEYTLENEGNPVEIEVEKNEPKIKCYELGVKLNGQDKQKIFVARQASEGKYPKYYIYAKSKYDNGYEKYYCDQFYSKNFGGSYSCSLDNGVHGDLIKFLKSRGLFCLNFKIDSDVAEEYELNGRKFSAYKIELNWNNGEKVEQVLLDRDTGRFMDKDGKFVKLDCKTFGFSLEEKNEGSATSIFENGLLKKLQNEKNIFKIEYELENENLKEYSYNNDKKFKAWELTVKFNGIEKKVLVDLAGYLRDENGNYYKELEYCTSKSMTDNSSCYAIKVKGLSYHKKNSTELFLFDDTLLKKIEVTVDTNIKRINDGSWNYNCYPVKLKHASGEFEIFIDKREKKIYGKDGQKFNLEYDQQLGIVFKKFDRFSIDHKNFMERGLREEILKAFLDKELFKTEYIVEDTIERTIFDKKISGRKVEVKTLTGCKREFILTGKGEIYKTDFGSEYFIFGGCNLNNEFKLYVNSGDSAYGLRAYVLHGDDFCDLRAAIIKKTKDYNYFRDGWIQSARYKFFRIEPAEPKEKDKFVIVKRPADRYVDKYSTPEIKVLVTLDKDGFMRNRAGEFIDINGNEVENKVHVLEALKTKGFSDDELKQVFGYEVNEIPRAYANSSVSYEFSDKFYDVNTNKTVFSFLKKYWAGSGVGNSVIYSDVHGNILEYHDGSYHETCKKLIDEYPGIKELAEKNLIAYEAEKLLDKNEDGMEVYKVSEKRYGKKDIVLYVTSDGYIYKDKSCKENICINFDSDGQFVFNKNGGGVFNLKANKTNGFDEIKNRIKCANNNNEPFNANPGLKYFVELDKDEDENISNLRVKILCPESESTIDFDLGSDGCVYIDDDCYKLEIDKNDGKAKLTKLDSGDEDFNLMKSKDPNLQDLIKKIKDTLGETAYFDKDITFDNVKEQGDVYTADVFADGKRLGRYL